MRSFSNTRPPPFLLVLAWTGFFAAVAAGAAQTPSFELTIKDQQFQPATLTIPPDQQVKITVNNEDGLPAEIESNDFNLEKVIPGHSQNQVYVGPLQSGRYSFFNEFHQSSKGKLIVK